MESLAYSALLPDQVSALHPLTHPLKIPQNVNKSIILKRLQRGTIMLEAMATVSFVASIIQLVDFSTRVVSRLDEFYSIAKEALKSFRHIETELPLLPTTLAQLKEAIDTTSIANGSTTALVQVIVRCNKQVATSCKVFTPIV